MLSLPSPHRPQCVLFLSTCPCILTIQPSLISENIRYLVFCSEYWDFWHVSNSSSDFERDWARAFFLAAGAWSSISAFKRVWALLPNHKRPRPGKEWIHDPFVNKPDQLTLFMLEEDQLVEITDGSGLKSMVWDNFKISIFWIKIKVEYPEIAKNTGKPASISNILSLWSKGFCSDSNQNKIMEYTGHKQHTSGVSVSHCPQMGLSSCRENKLRVPNDSTLSWVVYHYMLQCNNRNKVQNKHNAFESSWNHPPTPRLWKHCLLQNWSLVPKRLRTTVLLYYSHHLG